MGISTKQACGGKQHQQQQRQQQYVFVCVCVYIYHHKHIWSPQYMIEGPFHCHRYLLCPPFNTNASILKKPIDFCYLDQNKKEKEKIYVHCRIELDWLFMHLEKKILPIQHISHKRLGMNNTLGSSLAHYKTNSIYNYNIQTYICRHTIADAFMPAKTEIHTFIIQLLDRLCVRRLMFI